MASSDSGLTDEVTHELNGTSPEPDYGPQPEPIGDRPADGATKTAWQNYVRALGLHPDEAGKYSKPELADLATRLGG